MTVGSALVRRRTAAVAVLAMLVGLLGQFVFARAAQAAATAKVTVSLSPDSIDANGPSSDNPNADRSTATVTLTDSTGAAVSGISVTWSTNGDVGFFPSSCTSGPDGSCQVIIRASGTADDEIISAITSDGRTGTAKLHEYADPTEVDVTPPTQHVYANGTDITTVTATVKGAGNVPATKAPVTFSTDGDMTFPDFSLLDTPSCTTDETGTCSVRVQASTSADTETITASSGGASGTATIVEDPVPIGPLTVGVDPYAIAADGASTSNVTAAIAGDGGGTTITFTASPSGVTFLPASTCVTEPSGQCLPVEVKSSTSPGVVKISASDGSSSTSTRLLQYGSAAVVSLSPRTQKVLADGRSQVTVNALVTDSPTGGNPVGDATVTFGTDGDMTFLNGSNTCTTGHTKATVGQCAVTLVTSTTAGTETVTGTTNGKSGTAEVVEVAPAAVTVSLTPASVVADGASHSTAVATVTDQNGSPVASWPVTWTTSSGSGAGDVTFSNSGKCTTANDGKCAVTITSSRTADTETIKATAGSASGSAPLAETAPPPPPAARSGYWLVGQRGDVYAFGDAPWSGNAALGAANAVDIEGAADGNGYWILDSAGHVAAFGSALWYGDMALHAGEKATSMSALPGGGGYWVFTDKGRAQAFGAANGYGDMSGQPLNGPVVGSVATPSGHGYYMVASDGGIFAFGDAAFYGSMGGERLNKPVVGLVPDPDGVGYWLDASDGGVFAFEAGFRGSMGDTALNKPVIGMVSYGDGYLMVASDGGVFDFSDRPFSGSLGSNPPAVPIVNIAAQAT